VFLPSALDSLPELEAPAIEHLDGGAIRVTGALKPGAPAQEALRRAFAQGLDISRFELREPNLHDAFIVLTDGAAPAR